MDKRPDSVFLYGQDFKVTSEVQNAFDTNGYIILKGLLDNEEMDVVKSAVENEDGVLKHKYPLDDGDGRQMFMALWNQPGNDVTGILARSRKVVDTFEALLGGELYHYHTKLLMKEARTGGKFQWHQDYGYWYNNGALFPDMGTVWISVDKTSKENGSVKLLSGSHKMGRIEHVRIGNQIGADLERVSQAEKVFPLVQTEFDPGDAMFFHSNVLHRSEVNDSDNRRWALAAAYNRKSNNPVYEHHHPFYTPLDKVENNELRSCTCVTDMSGKDFLQGPSQQRDLKEMDKN